MRRRLRKKGIAALAAAGIALAATAALLPQPRAATTVRPIEIRSAPIEPVGLFPSPDRRGARLTFIGGLRLSSDDPAFGGLSGLERLDDGRFLAVGDRGSYVVFRLVTKDGRASRIEDATIGPTRIRHEQDGRTIDAEDLVRLQASAGTGTLVGVAIERRNAPVRRFRLLSDGLVERSVVRFPPEAAQGYNRGIESIALAPPASPIAGRLAILAERPRKPAETRIPGWIEGLGAFRVRRRDGFDVTAMCFLSDGDLLLLERRLELASGLSMRLRRIDGSTVGPGELLDGEVLLEADLSQPIDNMEGLAVHEDGRGTVLTLVSDDNFVPLQRTVLLQFRLADSKAEAAHPGS